MNQNNIAIAVSALSFRVQQVTILEGINLSIPRGAVVGLVGRNGAGKTSLLKCMAGLATPSKGAAYLLGFDSANLPDSVLERLGYVAQTADLFEWMEVSQMLQTIGQAYPAWSQERCLKLAARLDLPMGSMIKNLSGGDQQKLALVLALAHDPDVLLLDEPVSGLDPITRSEFMRSLFADRTEGNDQAEETGARTVVISSHLLTDLQRVVSHVAFIRDGRLQLFDTWDAMLEHFRLVRSPQADIPSNAIVCRNAVNGHCVVDTRMAAQYAGLGRTLSLEELFAELNA